MSDTRRPGHKAELKSTAESPAKNKITFREGTDEEFTILLKVPRGEPGRELTLKLIPFLKHLKAFTDSAGNVEMGFGQFVAFMDVAKDVWGTDGFEKEILPGVFDLEYGDEKLNKLSLMEAFVGFMSAISYIMAGVDSPEVVEAEKK